MQPPPLPSFELPSSTTPPPLPPLPAASARGFSRSALVAWIVGATVLTFFATNFLWLSGWGLWMWWQDRQLPPFEISLNHPPEIGFGDVVQLSVDVHNPRDDAQMLDSIDIYHSFLRGFEVVEIEPSASHTRDIADFRSFAFSQEVPPESTLQIRFTLKARRAGNFIGSVDVCDPEQKFTSAWAEMRVLRPRRVPSPSSTVPSGG